LANLEPIQERRHYYENHPDEVKDILLAGNARARETARQTMAEVREAIAFNLDFQRWI
jgi:tryptophanyl-tRNA synthetase